jgi:hypothetical protein
VRGERAKFEKRIWKLKKLKTGGHTVVNGDVSFGVRIADKKLESVDV